MVGCIQSLGRCKGICSSCCHEIVPGFDSGDDQKRRRERRLFTERCRNRLEELDAVLDGRFRIGSRSQGGADICFALVILGASNLGTRYTDSLN